MDLRHLRTFVTVAEQGTVSKASLRLRIAQPALSRQIKELEEELGLKLFNREHQGLVITDAGHEYLAVVRDAFDRIALGTDRLLQAPALGCDYRQHITGLCRQMAGQPARAVRRSASRDRAEGLGDDAPRRLCP